MSHRSTLSPRALALGVVLSLSACDDEPTGPAPLPPLPDIGALCEPRCDQGIEDMLAPDLGPPALPQCSDGVDNDGDGLIDGFDDGCDRPEDDDEYKAPIIEPPPPPECSDGLDNDEDGFTDYPTDRGCGAPEDLTEGDDHPTVPQCSDERDNDGDGLIDNSDPGCEDADDPLELNGPQEPRPWCSDGIDNDGDGFTDFPRDPGCASAADNDELTPPFPPACMDDEDNDGDGLIDFPFDPGCAGVGDPDETDRTLAPQCSDGLDNDEDGAIDYPDDDGCLSRGDDQELGVCGEVLESGSLRPGVIVRGTLAQGERLAQGSCGGGGGREIVFRHTVRRPLQALVLSTEHEGNEVESALYVRRLCATPESEVLCSLEPVDGYAGQTVRLEKPALGEYFIFLDGATNASGAFALSLTEEEIPQCQNGVDDDFDARTDFPADPGCESPFDELEADPAIPPICADELDNDQDGLSDFPNDAGCLFAGDMSEEDLCGQGVPLRYFPTGSLVALGNTAREGTSRFEGSCGGGNILEQVFLYEQPFSAKVTFSVDHPETEQPTILYVRQRGCLREGADDVWLNELACNVGADTEKATLTIGSMPPGEYFVFVDHLSGAGGPYKLTAEMERLAPSCQNGLDDDADGHIDGDDLGCADPFDDLEGDEPSFDWATWGVEGAEPAEGLAPLPPCTDGLDNDGDGLIDYPFDPDCAFKAGLDEAPSSVSQDLPQCANGRDDDRDELIDLADPGCSAASDPTELDVRPSPACSNRLDDDRDGLIDFPYDPACLSVGGLSEHEDGRPSPCLDELDNDDDGLTDFPLDPGCEAAGGQTESRDTERELACANGLDDNEDGRIDFPADPGCLFAADDSEESPVFTPACANGLDDDRDNQTDWPNDPQCSSASDTSEHR